MKLSLYAIVAALGPKASLAKGDGTIEISSVSGVAEATSDMLTFLYEDKYRDALMTSQAGVVLVKSVIPELAMPQITCANPYADFARVAMMFFRYPLTGQGQSKQAFIHAEANVDPTAIIYPFVTIDKHAVVGANVVLMSGCFIGTHAVIGDGSILFPNVVVMDRSIVGKENIIHSGSVIGADGFGFAPDEGEIVKIPQIGIAETADHVELGTHVSIDRGTHGKTYVGTYTKFDNKVHLGHNVQIGSHCMFAAQFSVAGSTHVGNWVMAGGLSGVSGHIKVADHTKIGAMTGVISETESGKTYMGFPAVPAGDWRRQQVLVRKLADSYKRIASLEEKLARLEARLDKISP